MSYLQSLYDATYNVLTELSEGYQKQREESECSSIFEDRHFQPIQEPLDGHLFKSSTLTIDQLNEKIQSAARRCIVAKEARIAKSMQYQEERRNLRQELQKKRSKLEEKIYEAQNAPLDKYQEILRIAKADDDVPWAKEIDQQVEETTTSYWTSFLMMQSDPCTALEADLLKTTHLAKIAEKQLQMQSGSWNDVVMTLHETPVTLKKELVNEKIQVLDDIFKAEAEKARLEQAGEEKLRKQVMLMCQLKRHVAKKVKRSNSESKEARLVSAEDGSPGKNILQSPSSDAGLDEAFISPSASPKSSRPQSQRQSSSLRLRLAREKAAARLADSRRKFSGRSVMADDSSSEIVTSPVTVPNNFKGSSTTIGRERIVSPTGVEEFSESSMLTKANSSNESRPRKKGY
eukprot:scaffold4061_cov108-Cylindrotheca_fusiformis.AAC.16